MTLYETLATVTIGLMVASALVMQASDHRNWLLPDTTFIIRSVAYYEDNSLSYSRTSPTSQSEAHLDGK
ncbi:MAG: hypothetical protein GY774_21470 [Planctomycetes bacterium]|nr:hypothetical protein [Planctomycetota bacterium]